MEKQKEPLAMCFDCGKKLYYKNEIFKMEGKNRLPVPVIVGSFTVHTTKETRKFCQKHAKRYRKRLEPKGWRIAGSNWQRL